jgi:predicted secreted acid phosphatase
MRRFTLTTLAVAAVAAAAPAAASAATPAGSVGTLAPPPKVVQTTINGVPMYETYDGGGGLPYLGVDHSYNAGDWEDTLREYHDGPTYQAQLMKVDSIADRWVKAAARHNRHKRGDDRAHRHDHHNGTGHHKSRKLAVVFDVDETALSNYTAIEADNFTFGTNSQNEAQNQVGTAIDPTLQVFNDAKARRIAVFFITGRGEAVRTPTEQNLTREGYSGWKKLYLKPAGSTLSTVQYKTGARKDIESQGYKIIANIGDQYSDLAGGHAQRAFKLANPFYFLP